jgi:hypothetical protein
MVFLPGGCCLGAYPLSGRRPRRNHSLSLPGSILPTFRQEPQLVSGGKGGMRSVVNGAVARIPAARWWLGPVAGIPR